MLTTDEAMTRVARGAAHLDQVRPGWWNQIDVGTLTLHDPCGCVVGQLCGTGTQFQAGCTKLGGPSADHNIFERIAWAIGHGFDNDEESALNGLASFQRLQDAWIAAIADRRLASGDNERTENRSDVCVT